MCDLYVDSHTSEDPDGGIAWNTISIYELRSLWWKS